MQERPSNVRTTMMTARVLFHQNIFLRFLGLAKFVLPMYTLCTLLVASLNLLQAAAKMDKASHL